MIDLGGGLGGEDIMPCGDTCAGKLRAAVAHTRGAAVDKDIAVRGQAQNREFLFASVHKGVLPFLAFLAAAHLLPRALFQEHQRDAPIDDGIACTADIADLRERELGGKECVPEAERKERV